MRFVFLFAFALSLVALGSSDIQSDLNDFKSLLPKFRVGLIASKHYIFNSSFRKAIKFLKSNEFKALIRKDLAHSPELREIADYLGRPVSLDFVEHSFRSVNLNEKLPENAVRPRSFTGFVDEVINVLPINKIKEMIRQKENSNAEFRQFYRRLTDPRFKELVYRAWNSESLRNAVRTLESNEIKVDKVLQSAFALLDKISH